MNLLKQFWKLFIRRLNERLAPIDTTPKKTTKETAKSKRDGLNDISKILIAIGILVGIWFIFYAPYQTLDDPEPFLSFFRRKLAEGISESFGQIYQRLVFKGPTILEPAIPLELVNESQTIGLLFWRLFEISSYSLIFLLIIQFLNSKSKKDNGLRVVIWILFFLIFLIMLVTLLWNSNFYTHMTLSSNDCDTDSSDKTGQDLCYSNLAKKENNSSLCNKIWDLNIKEDCYLQ